MQKNQTVPITDKLLPENLTSRRKMLPLWIKIFTWFFLIATALTLLDFFSEPIGPFSELGLYGLESVKIFSFLGIFILLLFVLKGITAFGLLREKDWAIKLGLADAIIGILICILVMCYPIINKEATHTLRLELIFLIPYLLKLLRIKKQWEAFVK